MSNDASQQDEHDRGDAHDAVDAEPVKQYYDEKKARYLRHMRDAAQDMKAGTPFDWEDAERYAEDGDDPDGAESAKD